MNILYNKIKTILLKKFHDVILNIYYLFNSPRLIKARKWYKYSDEHLKYVHILEAINYLRVAGMDGKVLPQTYLEFGCHSARTFSAAINAGNYLHMDSLECYAFDSFEGLPDTDIEEDGYFKSGTFCTSRADFIRIVKEETGFMIRDSHIIQGYYCNSLNSELQFRMPKAGVVHIDVDLYSSTVDVLLFLSPLLVPGTLLLFDDWYTFSGGEMKGERKALKEYIETHPGFTVEPWKAYSTFGQSFFVTSVND